MILDGISIVTNGGAVFPFPPGRGVRLDRGKALVRLTVKRIFRASISRTNYQWEDYRR